MSARHVGLRRFASLFALALLAPSIALIATVSSVGAATPAGPFTVDLTNREEARRFYYAVHQASEGVALGWTGNVSRCEPGTISADFLDATLTRINWFRAMAGVASDVVFTAENNAKAQAAALIMSAQRALSHNPPATWKCWTQQGVEGASANLTIGSTGPPAIDQLIKDGSAVELGHRRNILNPQHLTMGSGSIPAHADVPASEAQYMATNPSPVQRPARDGFVAWPPPGFVPYQTVFPAWSFVLRGADFANATVSMARNGAPVASTITTRAEWAGPGIVWLADGLAQNGTWPRPAADDRITVTVGNVVVNGAARAFTYDVTVFDPELADPGRTPLRITGSDAPPVGAAGAYSANPIPNSIGYQWRTTKLTPLTLVDGAEAGLANFDAVVDDYDPVSSNFAASGASSFRLTIGQTPRPPASGTETLIFKRTIVPAADTQLTFKARAIGLTNVRPMVQVSVDGGAWTTIFTEGATDEAAFGNRTVPLGAFANRLTQIRYRVEPAGTGAWACCSTEGWYLDDIAFVNGFEGVAALSDVGPNPTTTITPADAAPFNLEVRAHFFGSGAGGWSPVKRITPLVPAVAPAITTQPAAVTVTAGGTAAFTVAAAGTAPLTFLWSRDGVALADAAGIEGSRAATLRLTNVQAAQAGSYTVRVSNSAAAVTSGAAVLTVNQPPPVPPPATGLAAAVDTTLAVTGSGNTPWTAQTTVTHDGNDAARSGPITNNQRSTLQVTGVQGPATVSFWWKVDSEATFDFLTVELDGIQPFTGISGDIDWQQRTINIPAGTHTLQWHYSKDESVSERQDAAWIDQLTITEAAPPAPAPPTPAPPATGLAAAVDTTLAVTGSGNTPWTAQTTVTHDGNDAARSGPITNNQRSTLQVTGVQGPATVSFWWKVDSEATFDFLTVELDGIQPFTGISGDIDWQQRTINIPAGTHTLQWHYSKDESVSERQDAAWIDQLTIT